VEREIALLAVRMAYANLRKGGPFFDRSRLFRISCSICSWERPRAAACSAQADIRAVKIATVAWIRVERTDGLKPFFRERRERKTRITQPVLIELAIAQLDARLTAHFAGSWHL
jgi:hypothetical protein